MRVFKTKKSIQSLIKLRRKGYTYESLAFIFGVDFSSIYHHCKGVTPKGHLVFHPDNFMSSLRIDEKSIISLLDIHLPHQKTYKEYLYESRMRDRFPNTYKVC